MITNMIKKALYLCMMAACCLMAASCSGSTDVNEGYTPDDKKANTGAPVITAVFDASDITLTAPITEGEPGQNLIITGQNLNNLKSLKFNGVAADLSKTYTALTKANVTIPTEFSLERINTIEYTTDMGSTTFAFVVNFPTLRIGYLKNEFAASGSVAEIIGKNFDYYDFGMEGATSKVKVGDIETSIAYVSAEGLGINIPNGTPDNSIIQISWVDFYGTSQTAEVLFRPTQGILFADISEAKRDKTDRCVTIEDDSQVTSTASALGTKHLHFNGDLLSYAWVEISFTQDMPNIGEITKTDDYYFVFEVLTADGQALLGNGYEFAWNNDWSNSYVWEPGNGYGLDTDGKWQTVRIPLKEMAPDGIGKAGDTMTLNLGFQPSKDYAADFRYGNFRIQKK